MLREVEQASKAPRPQHSLPDWHGVV